MKSGRNSGLHIAPRAGAKPLQPPRQDGEREHREHCDEDDNRVRH
jgi:hypothetical protein